MERFRTLVAFAGLIVAGCGGANITPGPGVANQNSAALAQHSPKAVRSAPKHGHGIPPYLYVTQTNADAVDVIRNKTYRDVGAILLSRPTFGVWLDRKGNLYEAEADNVSEFAPGNLDGGAPNFVYQADPYLSAPVAVTTDTHDNVFVTSGNSGTVAEYFQGDTRTPIAVCNIPSASSIYGVAVDSSGNVFVAVTVGNLSVNFVYVAEYPGGLKGCNLQDTGVQLVDQVLGGMAFDKNNNLLVANGTRVLVVAPPYSSITGTIGSGFSGATDVTLNKKNSLAFVADYNNGTVTLVSYPGGSNVTVLGVKNGIGSGAWGAVDWPNAAY